MTTRCFSPGIRQAVALAAMAFVPGTVQVVAQSPQDLIGRWDLVVESGTGTYPSWLEVRRSGYDTLVGSFVGRFGSARPVAKIEFDDGELRFTLPRQWEQRTEDLVFEGRVVQGRIQGRTIDDSGEPAKWSGVRAPSLSRSQEPVWDETRALFDGKSLAGWKRRFEDRDNGWVVRDGILINENPGNDLMTDEAFTDFRLEAEFRYPKGSNSGIYLRGRHEVQIEDNFGDEPESHKIGGVYGFLTPSINAARPAGEWQTLDITLVGRVVTIRLNDERVVDRQTIPGITGGAIDSDEGAPGPILIQGDHGPVEFRKIIVTPVVDE